MIWVSMVCYVSTEERYLTETQQRKSDLIKVVKLKPEDEQKLVLNQGKREGEGENIKFRKTNMLKFRTETVSIAEAQTTQEKTTVEAGIKVTSFMAL